MRVIKMLGAALISYAAFVGVSVNAQTPASCSWEITSSTSTSQQQTTYQRCKDNNSNAWFATRTLVSSAPFTSPPTCTISLIGNVANNGTCLQPNLIRTSTACQSGAIVGQACKYTNGILTQGPVNNDMAKYAVCGDASCPIIATEKGYNNQCRPGSQSQQYNNPIVEWSCQ